MILGCDYQYQFFYAANSLGNKNLDKYRLQNEGFAVRTLGKLWIAVVICTSGRLW
jgi:hypothetical protein